MKESTKILKRKIEEKRKKRNSMTLKEKIAASESVISAKEFFRSGIVTKYLLKKVESLLRREHRPFVNIHIFWDENLNTIAFTDNRNVEINAAHELFGETKEERFKRVVGAATHELSHYLFTNFTELHKYVSALSRGSLYPIVPKFYEDYEDEEELQKNLSEFQDFLDGKIGFIKSTDAAYTNREWITRIAHRMSNRLEDGRIEYLFGELHYGEKVLFEGLTEMVKAQFNSAATIDELLEAVRDGELFEFEALGDIILHYVRFGGIKGYNHKQHRDESIIKSFMKVQNYIDDYKESLAAVESLTFVNKILICLWPELKRFIDAINERIEIEGGSYDGIPQMMDERSVVMPQNGDTQTAEGETEGSDSREFKEANPKAKGKESKKEKSDEKSKDKEKAEEDTSSEKKTKEGSEEETEAKENETKNETNEDSEEKPSKESSEEETESAEEEKSHRSEERETRTESVNAGKVAEAVRNSQDGENNEETITEDSTNAKVDYKKLYKEYAENVIEKQEENEIESEHDFLNSGIEYNHIHDGIGTTFIRHQVTQRNIDDFNRIKSDVDKLVKEMLRKSDFLQNDDEDVTFHNKVCGQKFNAGKVAKGDYKYYDKNVHIDDKYGLDVIVLCDESGSMCGNRIQACKSAAICIYEFMRRAVGNEHVSVYGHSTDSFGLRNGNHVKIVCYADFDNPDEKDIYRMMNMSAGGSNRDGYALKFCEEKLKERDAERKLLITISDGQPADSGYFGEPAKKDIQSVLKDCDRDNIMYISAAIGSDLDEIKDIYGDKHFLDLTDLSMLPHKLTSLIARLLR